MAALALGAIGGYFFGPLGFLIGSFIGNLLFPQKQEGPRLTDLKLHNSGNGLMIPISYGSMRLPGIVIYMSDLREHAHHSGGKGGPDVTTYTYSASFAEYICEGVIDTVKRIWADGKLIYDATNPDLSTLPCVVYQGTETQIADPTMEAELGVGNVPGYRGIAYVMFDDWDLSPYGNRIPNLNFEVATLPPLLSIVQSNYNATPLHTYVGLALPLIWNSTQIVIAGENFSDSKTTAVVVPYNFDSSTLLQTSAYTPPPALSFPCYWAGISPTALGIGNYVYADGHSTPMWRADAPGTELLGSGPNYLAGNIIYTGSVTTITHPGPVYEPTDPAKFLHNAGVTDGLYLNGSCFSQDGKTLYVFTAPSNTLFCDTWWKIVDGLVVSHGTISPPLALEAMSGNAQPHGVPGDGSVMSINVAENGGQYIWYHDGASGGVRIFEFVSGNLQDWGHGSLTIPWPTGAGQGIEAGMINISDGYTALARGHSVVVLSRFGPSGGIPLSDIVQDQSERAGLTGPQIDVSQLTDIVDGYAITQQQDVRQNITPLQSAYYFDGVESSGVMKFVKRGLPAVLTIPDNDLAAQTTNAQAPALITVKRVQEVDLPQFLTVKYVAGASNYETGVQFSQRQTVESQKTQTIDLLINMSDSKGKQVVNTLLFNGWVERMLFTILASRKYLYLEPTDVVIAHGYELRIMEKKETTAGLVQFDGPAAVTGLWTQGPTGVTPTAGTTVPGTVPQDTDLVLMDISLINDTDNVDGIYAAMAGAKDATWRGANLYKSIDGGNTFSQVAASGPANVIGSASTALDDFGGGNMFDELNSVTVVIGVGGGTLSSASEQAVLNGANEALLGQEILQFKNANLIAANTYVLTGLLRGRRGTEWRTNSHVSGEIFVLSPFIDVPGTFADLGQTRAYKAVTFGNSLAATQVNNFMNNGGRLRCYSPTQLAGGVNTAGDIVIDWVRRTRIGGQWQDYSEVQLGEASEQYVLQIWDSTFTVCARVVTGLTSPTFTYTSAMQVTDFGAQQQTIYVTVGQIGAFGLGVQAHAIIAGAGASVNTPLSPKQPYNTTPPPTPASAGCQVSGSVQTDTVTWGSAGTQQIFSASDFGQNDAWVLKFVVPSTPGAWIVTVEAVEYGGPPTPRDAAFSLSPCGVPVTPFMAAAGDVGISMTFCSGLTNNPNNFFQVQSSTTYYLTITTEFGVSPMLANVTFKAKAN